jgi:hypothetical protein
MLPLSRLNLTTSGPSTTVRWAHTLMKSSATLQKLFSGLI